MPPADPSDALPTEVPDLARALLRHLPAFLRTASSSSAALRALWSESLAGADLVLGERMREGIALRIAQLYDCSTCVHTLSLEGRRIGLTDADVGGFRQGRSEDDKEQALLALTTKLVKQKGHHARMVIQVARDLGVTDQELIEVVALVALNTFMNYLTELDPEPHDHAHGS